MQTSRGSALLERPSVHPLRWIAVAAFVLSTALSYLDRSLLSVLAPLIKAEFRFSNQQLGWLISAFSLTYALASLPSGWLLDRLGVNRAISIAATLWSGACICTGLVIGPATMGICRGVLGAGEAASVPAFGKVNADYLKPEERALGAAVNGIGISLGLAFAPFFIGVALTHGWRLPFVICGLLGLLWVPLWGLVSRTFPTPRLPHSGPGSRWAILRDPALMALMFANVLWMSGYSLWTNWMTLYLIEVHHIDLQATKSLVWIPPLISNFGGVFGGWLSLRLVQKGVPSILARRRAIAVSAFGCLGALSLLLAPNARVATFLIAINFFFILAGSVNLYALPIDLYGAGKAGLAVSALTFAYGLLQTVLSPVIGWMGDHHLYSVPVWTVAIAPALASIVLLKVKAPATPL